MNKTVASEEEAVSHQPSAFGKTPGTGRRSPWVAYRSVRMKEVKVYTV
jgi:hypothetical protein